MSEMVERLALAMQAGIEGQPGDFEHMDPRPHQSYVKAARLAIEAMREPTAAMLAAGTAADWVGEVESRDGQSIGPSVDWEGKARPGIWRAMIDAALGTHSQQDSQRPPTDNR